MKAMQDLKAWFDGIHPYAFWIFLTVVAGGVVWGFRKLDKVLLVEKGKASLWERIPAAVQFLPATLFAALLAGLSAGSDPQKVFTDAVHGVFMGVAAVGGHHVLRALGLVQGSPPGSGDGGKTPPPKDPPSDLSSPSVQRMTLTFMLALALVGCGGAKDVNAPTNEPAPRAMLRGTVLTLTKITTTADQLCASTVRALKAVDVDRAEKVGTECLAALNLTAGALKISERVLDTWQAGSEERFGCAMRLTEDALRKLQAALGREAPDLLLDAMSLVRTGAVFAPDKCEVIQ